MRSAGPCVVMSHGGAGAAASVPVWPPPHLTQTSHTFIPIHNHMHRMVVMLDRLQLEHVYIHIILRRAGDFQQNDEIYTRVLLAVTS